ncbi:hypothetical protein B0H13DRAFT_1924889 [Mycena leptocephala]|nr:hypothetical protein B0H13DRAFT_1924889 [Mycena leptocephala]
MRDFEREMRWPWAEEVWMYGGAGWYRDRGGRGGRSRGGLGQLRDTHRSSKNLISMRSFSGNTGYLHNSDGAVYRCAICNMRSLFGAAPFNKLAPLLSSAPPSSSSYIVPVSEAVTAASQIIAYRPSCKQTSRRLSEGPHDSRSREYSVKATGLGTAGAPSVTSPPHLATWATLISRVTCKGGADWRFRAFTPPSSHPLLLCHFIFESSAIPPSTPLSLNSWSVGGMPTYRYQLTPPRLPSTPQAPVALDAPRASRLLGVLRVRWMRS